MLRQSTYALVLLILPSSSGCNVTRSIEQWKCDRFGMCHFGITPTVTSPAPESDPCQRDGPSSDRPGD